MAPPEVGRPLPRAADAWVTEEKWNGWVLHDPGHGPDWLRVRGGAPPGELWSIIVAELERAVVTEVRDLGPLGVSCRVLLLLPLAARRVPARTAWHDAEGAAPRLVTAYPRTEDVRYGDDATAPRPL